MKLSVIYSIFNRTKLFERGLQSLLWQTMMPNDFELVVVDDGSTEDVKTLLKKFRDHISIRYIRYDRRLHPIWKELNPSYGLGRYGSGSYHELWYHTQAISANIALKQTQGDVCAIIQPEMILSPNSLQFGYEYASQAKMVFGEIIRANTKFNDYLSKNKMESFDKLLTKSDELGREWEFAHMPDQGHYDMYWYVAFFPTAYAVGINGVDLSYQAGVYAEDDQFKVRMRMAGCEDRWGGRPTCSGLVNDRIVGIHQSHELDEGKTDKKQDRQGEQWNRGAERNRTLWRLFQENPYMIANTNLDYSPWGEFCITESLIL